MVLLHGLCLICLKKLGCDLRPGKSRKSHQLSYRSSLLSAMLLASSKLPRSHALASTIRVLQEGRSLAEFVMPGIKSARSTKAQRLKKPRSRIPEFDMTMTVRQLGHKAPKLVGRESTTGRSMITLHLPRHHHGHFGMLEDSEEPRRGQNPKTSRT